MTTDHLVITGYQRRSGGDWLVSVSVRPGTRVHVQVPAAVFDAGHLTEFARHVVDRLTTPHGVTPSLRKGAP